MSFYRGTLALLVILLWFVGVVRGRTTWKKVGGIFYLNSLVLSCILYSAAIWITGWIAETVHLSTTDANIANGVFITGYIMSFLSGFQVGRPPLVIFNEVWQATIGHE